MSTGRRDTTTRTTSRHMPGFMLLVASLAFLTSGAVLAAPGDVVLKRKEGAASGFPNAVFPHWIHRINYRCDACHNRLFEMRAGSAELSMADINAGKACGACHNDKTAFAAGFNRCNQCHVPDAAE